MADGFGPRVLADRRIEPASGIQSARFSSQRQTPLAEAFGEEFFFELREVAHAADAQRVQVFLRNPTNARNLADLERSEKRGLLAGDDPQHSVRFGLVRADL